MIDQEEITARANEHDSAPAASHAVQPPDGRRWLNGLLHRWPTALGVMVVALTALDLNLNVEFVAFLSALVIFMALIYVGSAALNQPRAAWTVFLAGFVIVVLLRSLAVMILPAVMLVAALGFLALGMVRGRQCRSDGFPLQAAGMLGFGAIALVALAVVPTVGAYLLAGALLAHGLWDAIHLWRNRVVARSYAEFCAVIDLLLGLTMLVVA